MIGEWWCRGWVSISNLWCSESRTPNTFSLYLPRYLNAIFKSWFSCKSWSLDPGPIGQEISQLVCPGLKLYPGGCLYLLGIGDGIGPCICVEECLTHGVTPPQGCLDLYNIKPNIWHSRSCLKWQGCCLEFLNFLISPTNHHSKIIVNNSYLIITEH